MHSGKFTSGRSPRARRHDARALPTVASVLLFAGLLSLGACVTTSTTPSAGGTVGLPGRPGSAGQTGTGGGQTGSSSRSGQSSSAGASAKPGGGPAGESAQTEPPQRSGGADSGMRAEGDAAAGSEARAPNSAAKASTGKSDDEILAEALAEFDRKNATAAGAGESSPDQASAGQTPGDGPGGALTKAEKTAMLQDQLNDRFAKFDKVMLQERESVAKEDNASGNRGFSDRSAFDDGETGTGEDASAPPARNAGGSSANVPGKNVPADARPTYGEVPPDLASADGDDIIARQLREAAMKEPDPELREKLWNEYRKYKRSQK